LGIVTKIYVRAHLASDRPERELDRRRSSVLRVGAVEHRVRDVLRPRGVQDLEILVAERAAMFAFLKTFVLYWTDPE
jgi:hypothetical protein